MSKYHMNKKDREIVDKTELNSILSQGKYAIVALCRDNEPYAVTLSYGYDDKNNALYFHSAKKGLKIDFMNANPNVCATVIQDNGYKMGQCEHDFASVVMWGKLTMVDDIEEKKHAFDVLIGQLEDKPEEVKARIFKNEKVYEGVGILKMDIEEMTGKKGS